MLVLRVLRLVLFVTPNRQKRELVGHKSELRLRLETRKQGQKDRSSREAKTPWLIYEDLCLDLLLSFCNISQARGGHKARPETPRWPGRLANG